MMADSASIKATLQVDTTTEKLTAEILDVRLTLEVSLSLTSSRPGRIYIFDQISDNPIVDISSGYRYSRPEQWYRRWLPEALRLFWEKENIPSSPPERFRWSQYAGCTCPCSPGFISPDLQHQGRRIYISIREIQKVTPHTLSPLLLEDLLFSSPQENAHAQSTVPNSN